MSWVAGCIGGKDPGIKPAPPGPSPDRIFTGNFILLWIANCANFSAFYLLLTTLPMYLVDIGLGKSDIGLLIGVLSVTAVVARPFVGRLADNWGKKWVAAVGALILALSFTLYLASTTMPQLVALHVLRGVGWSAFLTAVLALVADLAPPARRGETVGYFGMANNLAMALSPSAGVLVLNAFGFGSLFMTASAVVSVSFLSTVLTSRPARGATEGPGPRSRFDFIELLALFPMLVICFFATAYGSLVIYLPLYSPERGLDNPGLFFIPYSLVAMSTRSLAGRTSDRLGRSITIVPGMLLAAVALVVHSQAASVSMFITVAVMFGLAFSLVTPSLMALLIDRVRPEARGVAVGTFTAGFDLGVGLGAFISGRLLELMDFPAMYRLIAGAPLAGLVIFVLVRRTHRREGPSG